MIICYIPGCWWSCCVGKGWAPWRLGHALHPHTFWPYLPLFPPHLILHPYSQALPSWATYGIPPLTVAFVWHFCLGQHEQRECGLNTACNYNTIGQTHIHIYAQRAFSIPRYGLALFKTCWGFQRSGPRVKRNYTSWTGYKNFLKHNIYLTSFNFHKAIVIQFLKYIVHIKQWKIWNVMKQSQLSLSLAV